MAIISPEIFIIDIIFELGILLFIAILVVMPIGLFRVLVIELQEIEEQDSESVESTDKEEKI